MRVRLHARMLAVIGLTALVVVGGSAAALAAAPIKGATYRGKLKLPRASTVTFPITFKVSANGKRVSNFNFAHGYPVYCQGGGFGRLQAASGPITQNGTFTVKLPIYFAPAHSHQGFVVVTGTFGKRGKESGRVKTDFTASSSCSGTATYTTTG